MLDGCSLNVFLLISLETAFKRKPFFVEPGPAPLFELGGNRNPGLHEGRGLSQPSRADIRSFDALSSSCLVDFKNVLELG